MCFNWREVQIVCVIIKIHDNSFSFSKLPATILFATRFYDSENTFFNNRSVLQS